MRRESDPPKMKIILEFDCRGLVVHGMRCEEKKQRALFRRALRLGTGLLLHCRQVHPSINQRRTATRLRQSFGITRLRWAGTYLGGPGVPHHCLTVGTCAAHAARRVDVDAFRSHKALCVTTASRCVRLGIRLTTATQTSSCRKPGALPTDQRFDSRVSTDQH